jgi:hypothetical protein
VQLSSAAAVVMVGALFATQLQTGGDGSSQTAAKPAGLNYAKTPPEVANQSRDAATRKLADSAGSVGAVGGGAAGSGGGTALTAGSSWTSGTYTSMNPGTAPQPVTAPKVDAPATDDGAARVVKSGSIALVVKDQRVSPTLTAVQNAGRQEGGYVAASSSDEYGDTPSGEVTIRVPVAHFENLVARVRGLDAKVRTASTTGKDVTAQYTDLQSQLKSLTAARDRFLTILGRARTISEILSVQQRVDTVNGQIDRIEGQRKLLASQSDLSTLTVSVSEAGDPIVKATQKPRSGLSQAFVDAKDGFVSGVESLIRHSGGFLLFVICLVLVLAIGRSGWRLARRRLV